ncbi:MAG: DUF262 domain-containing protein [Leucobacter sp.]|nr:DUF262 domain-containing protein [Leucobacter sp.]
MIQSISNDAVHALFSHEHNVVYQVPKYQREYSWGRDQWDALIDDLLEQARTEGHFLGTIICVNKTSDAVLESVLEVIDGQQRLTTISLLLTAIHRILLEHRSEIDEDDMIDFLNLKRMLVLKGPARPRLRPQLQRDNDRDYRHVLADSGLDIEDPRPPWVGNRRIKKAYGHFLARIEEEAATSNRSILEAAFDLLRRVKQANIVKLEMQSHADAFTLFESLNNRGMPLTPIDLIKNSLLGKADQPGGFGIDAAYDAWSSWLEALGDDYSTQERFFRYFYDAMKDEFGFALQGAREATRSNVIRIYEAMIDRDLALSITQLSAGVRAFSMLMGSDTPASTDLETAFKRLRRAQGLPGHVLLLHLLIMRDELAIDDRLLVQITDLLTAFFVRRNMTNLPATSATVRLMMDLIQKLRTAEPADFMQILRTSLAAVSADDEHFERILLGPVYDLNTDVVRFILTDIAEQGMTRETFQDLWVRTDTRGKSTFVWSIEHVLPQGELTPQWIDMLGGSEAATSAHEQYRHHLGNLTITGYNSSLGQRSFTAKRDHQDKQGNWIGYRNQLNLNSDLAQQETWGVQEIQERSSRLAAEVLARYPL